jgi:hypothetical protein
MNQTKKTVRKNRRKKMSKVAEIEVRNTLNTEKRDLNIYHQADRSAYMISHSSIITIPLGNADSGDYLHISAVGGPGRFEKECCFDIPGWCDFTVTALGNADLIHSNDRTLLIVPPGAPSWQIKITQPKGQNQDQSKDYVSIGDRIR